MSETTTADQTLPPSLQPGYQPSLPASLRPQPRSPLYQLAGAPAAPSEPPPTPDQRNYTVGPVRPGDPGYQAPQPPQQGTDPRARPPDEYHMGQPIWHPRPGEQGYESPVALNRPPAFQLGHQPGPWPAAYPNSPQINPANAPGLPGETPQETAALNRFMGRESQGQNIINSVAAKNPESYLDPKAPRTASGYWQMVNSTWATGARLAGIDIRQWPTAMSAPYQVQRQVALALYRSKGGQPWAESAENRTNVSGNPQQPLPAEPRDYREWGRDDASLTSAPPRDFGPGPSGQGGLGQPPQESGWVRVLNGVGPLLVGIASLALRLPLSTAITAAGAMARAQDNGQREAYERARTRMQDQLKEANAQQTLESREASDAFVEYGNNNPAGLQQTLAQIALRYNDPIMYRMAEQGDLNGIHQLQQKRDLYNQDLTRANKAAQDEQDRREQDAAVAAMDRKWRRENPNASEDDALIAHNQHIGEVQRQFAGTRDPTTKPEQEGEFRNVVDKDGKFLRQVRLGKTGGLFDLSGNPTTINEQAGERLETPSKAGEEKPGQEKTAIELAGAKARTDDWAAAQNPPVSPDSNAYKAHLAEEVQRATEAKPEAKGPKPSDYKDYEWEGADDGQMHHGLAAVVPGKGLVDPQGNPINAKPGTINAVGTRAAAGGGAGKPYDIVETATGKKVSGPWELRVTPDGKVQRVDGGPLQFDPQTQHLAPTTEGRGGQPRFGTVDDLMQKWHEQFVADNGREPTTDEISKQRQTFTQESKPPAQSARQVSQRLGIAIGEAAGGIDALSRLSSSATLGPWGGAQAALSTNSFENFQKSLANKVTPRESRMLNSIASVIARPLASVEAAGVATGLVGVTDSLRREFPQAGDDGYTVLTKMANLRNIIDAAADQLVLDKTIAPEIRDLIARHRDEVDAAIPYTLRDVIAAEANPTQENMRGLAERLLHRGASAGQGGRSSLPPGVTVEVK